MSTGTHRNFLGIEVRGDIRYSNKKDQRPIEDLAPIIKAMLDDPTVAEFGWRQYTPYFNDGEPCIFGAHGAWVKLTTDRDDVEEFDIDYGSRERIGERPRTYNHATRTYEIGTYAGPDESRYDRCMALSDAIDGDEFDDALQKLFGDHATVTVTRDAIKVDFYEHD